MLHYDRAERFMTIVNHADVRIGSRRGLPSEQVERVFTGRHPKLESERYDQAVTRLQLWKSLADLKRSAGEDKVAQAVMEMHSDDRTLHSPVRANEKVKDDGSHHLNAEGVSSLLIADTRGNELEPGCLELRPSAAQDRAFQRLLN